MSHQAEKPTTVRIDLTEAQRQRVAEALGRAKLAADGMSIELIVDELEQRITPRIIVN